MIGLIGVSYFGPKAWTGDYRPISGMHMCVVLWKMLLSRPSMSMPVPVMAFRICESRMVLSSIMPCGQQADRRARLGAARSSSVRGGEQTYRDSRPIILFITEFVIGKP